MRWCRCPRGSTAFAALLAVWAAEEGVSEEEQTRLLLLCFLLLLLPVFFPILQKLYDGIVAQIILNCCRKKFNGRAACVALTQMLLMIPAFIARLAALSTGGSAGGGFNVAKLGRSTKILVDADKQQKDARKKRNTVKVTRRRKLEPEEASLYLAGGGAAIGLNAARAEKEEGDDGDDGDDGGDGGGDGGD